MYYILLAIFLILIITFVVWCYEQKQKFRSLENIPGPKTLPILGNVFEFGFNPVDQLKNLSRLSDLYKPFVKIWLGPKNVYVLTTDPSFFEFVLSSPKYTKKPSEYDFIRPWLKNGLLLSEGSHWQKRRKILTPAFHFKILEDFIQIYNTETSILIERLSKKVDIGDFNIYPFVTDYTLDVICETAMGTSVKAQTTVDNEYVNDVKIVCNTSINRLFSIWKRFDILFPFSNDYRKQNTAVKKLHGFTASVIKDRRRKLFNQHPSISQAVDVGMKKRQVFLDVLLNATVDGLPLSDEEIQEEVDTFMFEGHDTSASLISFTIYELARNPDVQDKLFAEVQKVIGDNKNHEISLHDLNNMMYTEFVLKEAMRMYPSVPYIGRLLEEDMVFNGTLFPKDTVLGLFIYGIQRRADLFPNPDKFDPDRFISKNLHEHHYSYVPFSAGPRNCIGQKFAMFEAKCTISKVILNYEISRADAKHDIELSSEVILKSANGVYVQLKRRELKK